MISRQPHIQVGTHTIIVTITLAIFYIVKFIVSKLHKVNFNLFDTAKPTAKLQ